MVAPGCTTPHAVPIRRWNAEVRDAFSRHGGPRLRRRPDEAGRVELRYQGESAAPLATAHLLARVIEALDPETGAHNRRVCRYACRFAEVLGIGPRERMLLEVGALLHDIGKLAVDHGLLGKRGPLTPAELRNVQCHPLVGVSMLAPFWGMEGVLEVVRNHHERWDGAGYPDRLAGDAIPLLARVVAVADVYDALTMDRPYRAALPVAAACRLIEDGAGSQFDPDLVTAFLRDVSTRHPSSTKWP